MMRKTTFILICLVAFARLNAQEKAILYSHYSFNGLAINPAYAGSHEMLSVSLTHRNQWMGFEGAPTYNIFGAHSTLKNTHVGLGLLVMNESIGLRKYTGIYLNYAHRMTLGRGKLALGLKGGIATGKMETVDLADAEEIFNDNTCKYLLPNFGVGAYYNTERFYAGLSIPLLLGYKTNNTGEVAAYNNFNDYAWYLTAGYNMKVSKDWKLQPSGLLEYDKPNGVLADIGLSLLYKDVLKTGISYRTKQAIVLLMDVKVNYQLRVGIAYDYGLNELNSYNRNSFEIALDYNFGYRFKASNPANF
jgi:type IX secretion system PorP/SprF family membrane protein